MVGINGVAKSEKSQEKRRRRDGRAVAFAGRAGGHPGRSGAGMRLFLPVFCGPGQATVAIGVEARYIIGRYIVLPCAMQIPARGACLARNRQAQ